METDVADIIAAYDGERRYRCACFIMYCLYLIGYQKLESIPNALIKCLFTDTWFFLEGEKIASLSLKRQKGGCTLMVVKKSLVCYKIYYLFNFDGQNVCFHISVRPLFPSE